MRTRDGRGLGTGDNRPAHPKAQARAWFFATRVVRAGDLLRVPLTGRGGPADAVVEGPAVSRAQAWRDGRVSRDRRGDPRGRRARAAACRRRTRAAAWAGHRPRRAGLSGRT